MQTEHPRAADFRIRRQAASREWFQVFAPAGGAAYPLTALEAGASRWVAGHQYARLRCERTAVEQVTAGNLLFWQDGEGYRLEAGDVFLLRPGCRHVYRTGPAGFAHKRCLTVDGPLLAALWKSLGLDGRDALRPRRPAKVTAMLRMALAAPREDARGLSRLAYALALELGDREEGAWPRPPAPLLAALEFLRERRHRSPTGVELGRHVGFSLAHLNRLFRRNLGVSPRQYLIRERLRDGARWLGEGRLSVQEISARLGYPNAFHFSRQFKDRYGLSPSAYRRRRAVDPSAGALDGDLEDISWREARMGRAPRPGPGSPPAVRAGVPMNQLS